MKEIHKSAKINRNVTIGEFTVVEEGVSIGEGVRIGHHVTICKDTVIGAHTTIYDHAVIGRIPHPSRSSTVTVDPDLSPLHIGKGACIGAGVVLYRGSIFDEEVMIGDQAFVREECQIGKRVVIGRGVAVENQVKIGDFTKIQTGAYITAYTTLEEHVFIAPMVTTTNDNFMGRTAERFKYIKGPTVKRGARVGGGAVLLPGVTVAEETFIAAGALVNKDTERDKVYAGVPARVLREVKRQELLKEREK